METCGYCGGSGLVDPVADSKRIGRVCRDSSCQVCREIQELDWQARKIDNEIKELRCRLLKLHQDAEKLQKERHAARWKVNSVHDKLVGRLPLEVMFRIFIHCLGPRVPTLEPKWWERMEAMPNTLRDSILLSSVCRTWRSIAHAEPRLWNVISLDFRPERRLEYKQLEPMFERSGTLPLSMLMKANPNSDVFADRDYAIVDLDLVNAQTHRWESLFISASWRLIRRIRGQAEGTPLLKKLIVNVNSEERMGRLGQFQLISTTPPAPTTLYLQKMMVQATVINWQELTTLELSESTVEECLFILDQAKKLRSANFGSLEPKEIDTRPTNMLLFDFDLKFDSMFKVDHQHLTRLKMSFEYFQPSLVLDHLTSPALESLQLLSTYDGFDDFVSFMGRSSPPNLQNLELYFEDPDPTTRSIPLFESLPQLRKLEVDICGEDGLETLLFDHFVSTARVTPTMHENEAVDNASAISFLPNLDSLVIHLSTTIDWTRIPLLFPPLRAASADPSHSNRDSQGDGTGQNAMKMQYRPLRNLEIYLAGLWLDDVAIDRETKKELHKLRNLGYGIKIMQGDHDLLEDLTSDDSDASD